MAAYQLRPHGYIRSNDYRNPERSSDGYSHDVFSLKRVPQMPTCFEMPGTTISPDALAKELREPVLQDLAADLMELELGSGANPVSRLAATAFVNGLRFAYRNPARAEEFAQKIPPDDALTPSGVFKLTPDLLHRSGHEIEILRAAFRKMLQLLPSPVQKRLAATEASCQAAWWIPRAVACGIRAGLDADCLEAGHLLAYVGRRSLSQQFISDRLRILIKTEGRNRRPLLIEFIKYTYPRRTREREVIVILAEKVLAELQRQGSPLDPAAWILGGFREGLFLSTSQAALRKELVAELKADDHRSAYSLFERYIGPDPARWAPERLIANAQEWCRKTHPEMADPKFRPEEFEYIRHLFDFSVWMGLFTNPDTIPSLQ